MKFDSMCALAEGSMSLNDATKLQKYELYKQDAEKISNLLRKARKEKSDAKAKKLYQEALKNAKDLKSKANRIPDNDVTDWLFDLFIKPWWWFLSDVVSASVKGDDITGLSRSQAVSHYDQLIKQIERCIDNLE